MKTHDEKVAAAQDKLAKLIVSLLDKHGSEATLEALAIQFGVCGSAAIICGAVRPVDFMGRYVFRSIAVCDSTCKQHYIEGVVS